MPNLSSPLIAPEELAAALDDDPEGYRVFDCRFDLNDPQAGAAEFAAGHIQGASYADLDRHLSRPPGSTDGRHPLPQADSFRQWLGEEGVTPDITAASTSIGVAVVTAAAAPAGRARARWQ